MNKIILIAGSTVTFIATLLSHLSLRGLVLCVGIFLALFSSHLRLFYPIDDLMLGANSVLFETPRGTSEIAIVRVPKDEQSTWQSDIHASGNLAALLANMLNNPDTVVGVLLQEPIDAGSGAADVLIESYLAVSDQAKALVDRKYILKDLLAKQRVVIGVNGFYFSGQKALSIESSSVAVFPLGVQKLLWPRCRDCLSLENTVHVARPAIEQFSLLSHGYRHDQRPFYFQALLESQTYQGTPEKFESFFVAYLKSMQGMSRDASLNWSPGEALSIGNILLPLSVTGQFIPLHVLSKNNSPQINEISFSEALVRSAFPKYILIASENNQQAKGLAQAIYSATNERIFYSPWWMAILISGLLLLATFYLVFVLARISARTACLISCLTIFSLVVAQSVLLLIKAIWMPAGILLFWIVLGHFVLLIWKIKSTRIKQMLQRADEICLDSARRFLQIKQADKALTQLHGCAVTEPLLKTLYEISDAFIEQKNYLAAVEVLHSIRKKNKSFRDVEQKLQVLNAMVKLEHAEGGDNNLVKTQLIDRHEQKPRILGRYKLDREIGRGAMGRVYLGFDPKISRRVAIKTLNYDQFNGKEQSEIKARFFREAEAAGRLSHPAIVSVFDVGEEADLAFIAMDYVDGKALNHFVEADNLLPVFEVYRIVCDVAQALQYAHDNHVVHRDIKPGNIIYNPSPYQIKVTDFGIARLIDNSKTGTGEILGSPLFMAPEQLKGERVNCAADIFSLGVTFYQLLTGKLPYVADSLAALTYEIIHGSHKSVRSVRKDLPASAARITNQALQKNPDDRYESAAEFALALKKAIKRDFAQEAKRVGYL